MVPYNFQARFAPPILAGTKTQTIRSDRKRHARPGEMLQLYTGLRRPGARLLLEAVCTAVLPIRMMFEAGALSGIRLAGQPVLDLDEFAVWDGFADAADMAAFWRARHDVGDAWEGVWIHWRRGA